MFLVFFFKQKTAYEVRISDWSSDVCSSDLRVWVYYFDTADPQRLMRTHVDLNTGQAGQDEIEVNNSVGATGSDNLAIRVHRHHTIEIGRASCRERVFQYV